MVSCWRDKKYFSVFICWIVFGNIFISVHFAKSLVLSIINTHSGVRADQKYINASKYLYTQYYCILYCTWLLRFIIGMVLLCWNSGVSYKESSSVFYSKRRGVFYTIYCVWSCRILLWKKKQQIKSICFNIANTKYLICKRMFSKRLHRLFAWYIIYCKKYEFLCKYVTKTLH